ncbi:MAG: fumarylacetoacetate hydrolase family protein [Alphaproteobacteria bacterium]|nr:fumarylacetoacetate hydrolase family protein [Alphaproteobacteria bacterium]
MKIAWFDDNRLGVVRGERVHDVTGVLSALEITYPYPPGDPLIAGLGALRPKLEAAADEAEGRLVAEVSFHSPVANPSKVIGTPANYMKHVEEAEADPEIITERFQGKVEQQGLFLKANSALVGPGDGIALRFPERRTDHELELGLVIGRTAADVPEAEALDYVAGYAIALDMSIRGPEDRSLRKSCDSYAVLGPWMVTADEIADPDNLDFTLTIGGETRQDSNTRHMILDTRRQISWASQFYTLHPGDIIMTGTCEGVGPIAPGEVLHCRIEAIGTMDVAVRAAG